MTIREFQSQIERIYLGKDSRRGWDGTFRWFVEEVGELARSLRHKNKIELSEEFADVFAWLASLASQSGIDLEHAAEAKYQAGCPKCRSIPCRCEETTNDNHIGATSVSRPTTEDRRRAKEEWE